MTEVIGVRFKKVGKVYYFDPCGITAQEGDYVVVETARGLECGEVAMANRHINDSAIVKPLKKVIRPATESDVKIVEENSRLEEEAFRICEEKIAWHKLEMKLVAVEYTFDHSKILFYFSADGRIDFRELVKDLASVFRTRIELRQIGVRDEAKMVGGLGICGRPLCCSTFLDDFQPVSINMAKEQGLSLNPTKISGTCGRLMCCLKYESDTYKDLLRNTPKVDAVVDTPQGRGTVMDVSLLKGTCKVRLHSSPDTPVVMTCAECGYGCSKDSCDSSCAETPVEAPAETEALSEAQAHTAVETQPVRQHNRQPREHSEKPERQPHDRHEKQARQDKSGKAQNKADGTEKRENTGDKPQRQHSDEKHQQNRQRHGRRQHNNNKDGKEAQPQQSAANHQDKPQRQPRQHAETHPAAEGEQKKEVAPTHRRRHRGGRGGQRRGHKPSDENKPQNNTQQ